MVCLNISMASWRPEGIQSHRNGVTDNCELLCWFLELSLALPLSSLSSSQQPRINEITQRQEGPVHLSDSRAGTGALSKQDGDENPSGCLADAGAVTMR